MVARRFAQVVWLPVIALILAVAGAQLHAGAPRNEANAVPLRLEDDGVITVQANINGDGPFRLLLDTGSNRSAVSSQVARRMRLAAVARTTAVSATGKRDRAVVRLDALSLGNITKRELLVAVLDEEGRAALGAGLDGILGQDFLLGETYTLDYEHRRLIWEADRSSRGDLTRLTLKEEEGRWLVALPQRQDGTDVLWFVPDSGASALVVFDRGTPLTLSLMPLPSCAMTRTATGSAVMRAVQVDRLRVGSVVMRNRPAVVVDRRSPDAPAGDGLLPLSMFESVSFDPTGSTLLVRAR
jgi:predicted aspartyl protease